MTARPRIAIAGGSGFIGRWIVRALIERGERIAVLSHRHLLTPDAINFVTASTVADSQPAIETFGAIFRSLDDGLRYLHTH